MAKTLISGNLAAMAAIAALTPVERTRFNLTLSPPMPDFREWAGPSRGKPTRKRRDRTRASMQKASRKKNRAAR